MRPWLVEKPIQTSGSLTVTPTQTLPERTQAVAPPAGLT
jgi:hypothetical protein